MGKKILVVAEKPSAANDMAKVLNCTEKHDGYIEGSTYVVTWAVGHLITLKEPQEHNPEYKKWSLEPLPFQFDIKDSLKVIDASKKQFNIVKSLIHREDIAGLINAGDAGREGYLIQEWIYRMAGNKKPKRVLWASSLDEEALTKAFADLKNPKDFENLLQEAEARAEGDFNLGMNFSRGLTLTLGGGKTLLRYGRCQITVLNQVVERDLEIENFVPVPYYNTEADYKDNFTGLLVDENNKKIDFKDKTEAENLIASLNGVTPVIEKYDVSPKKTQPPLLYNLAALQQAGASKYGFAPDKTLQLAQSLYEKKIMSYPRTDSRVLSTSIYHEIDKHLKAVGSISVYKPLVDAITAPNLDKRYVNDLKVTDHHALIPTLKRDMGNIWNTLTDDEKNLFDLVARSFIAAFYPPYEYMQTTLISKAGEHLFLSRGNTPTNMGYKAVFDLSEDDKDIKKDNSEEVSQTIPSGLKVGDSLAVLEYKKLDKKTKPPARYTDSSIIKMMEQYNIGTSATRAEILKKLQSPKSLYIERDKGKYISTKLGRDYIAIMPEELKSLSLLTYFEDSLKAIGEGRSTKQAFLNDLADKERQYIENFKTMGSDTFSYASVSTPEGVNCPKCGSPIRYTSKGYFCSKNGCGFALWPKMKFYTNELEITPEIATQLLSGSKKALFNLTSKGGKKYKAYLKIVLNGQYVNFDISEFASKRGSCNKKWPQVAIK